MHTPPEHPPFHAVKRLTQLLQSPIGFEVKVVAKRNARIDCLTVVFGEDVLDCSFQLLSNPDQISTGKVFRNIHDGDPFPYGYQVNLSFDLHGHSRAVCLMPMAIRDPSPGRG